jgi:hypothetical protein
MCHLANTSGLKYFLFFHILSKTSLQLDKMETLELIMGLEPREGNQQRLEELFHNLYYELAIPDDTNDTPTLNIVNVKAGREAGRSTVSN